MTEVQASYHVSWDDQAAIARCEWLPRSVCGRTEAEAVTDAVEAMGRGLVPLLVDMREMHQLERSGREHFLSVQGIVTAVALLTASPGTRMMANIFMNLKRVSFPVKMFTAEEAAVAWLQDPR